MNIFTRTLSIATITFTLLLSANAQAGVYYISPTGDDDASGTTTSTAWKSWAKAFGKETACGDTIIVLNGKYTVSNNGTPRISGKICASTTPLTVKALNQRMPLIQGDGSSSTFIVTNSKHIKLHGLRIANKDNMNGKGSGFVLNISNSPYVTVQRGIFSYPNRYNKAHAIVFQKSPHGFAESNELYSFHRNGIFVNNSDYTLVRRNYCNARNHADIKDAPASSEPKTGDACVTVYTSSYTTIENNISDGTMGKPYILQSSALSTSNRFFGNISIGATQVGLALEATSGNDPLKMPTNTIIKDHLEVNPVATGIRFRGTKNASCDHCTVIGGKLAYLMDSVNGYGDGIESGSITNSLALGKGGCSGFSVSRSVDSWLLNYNISHNYASVYNPKLPHQNIRNAIVSNPNMGTCYAWVPDDSPLKKRAAGKTDPGARILYRYNKGSLTSTPLWNRTTGKFPHGAIIAGVNDKAGTSAFDVHTRLNINTKGCLFPKGYIVVAQ
ncbi:MAG: hypothetical protein AABY33_02495 [Pseudomonadota bacterium]